MLRETHSAAGGERSRNSGSLSVPNCPWPTPTADEISQLATLADEAKLSRLGRILLNTNKFVYINQCLLMPNHPKLNERYFTRRDFLGRAWNRIGALGLAGLLGDDLLPHVRDQPTPLTEATASPPPARSNTASSFLRKTG